MREPSPGDPGRRGSSFSLGGSIMKNAGFQHATSSEHLPQASTCNTSITGEAPPGLVRSISNASALTSLSADLSPSDSHFFEVLYTGKVRISQRKVPESLIDDALTKFAQHDIEKARQARRHSLLSSTGTSIYSTESTESINGQNTETIRSKGNQITPSSSSLEPDKKTSENILKPSGTKNDPVDKEFDMFTKERVETPKKTSHTPLEPRVLILNAPKNNLGTVNEDHEHDEINSIISETASSITQFCQSNFLSGKNDEIEKDKKTKTNNNPFLKDINKELQCDSIEECDNEIDDGDEKTKPVVFATTTDTTKAVHKLFGQAEKLREDSPAPFNNDDMPRKLKTAPAKQYEPLDPRRSSPMPENYRFLRDRSASIGTLNLKTPMAQVIGEQNRTMLFQVARSELRLISPDRKQILLHRAFKDVASCVLGRVNKEYFGFVCRESTNDAYACYVFKCESDSVALEVANAIRQAFVAHAEWLKKTREKSPSATCEHCPMLWYHRMCHDLEGMNDKKCHAFILRRIEQLPEDEQETIITKYQGGTNHMYETTEHNSFLLMLLRAHCEAKQLRHVHDTAENRSEFLNQYLGGSTIFMKAKRSLSSGFDHLLKRRASKDDLTLTINTKKEPSPLPPSTPTESNPELLSPSPDRGRSKSVSPAANYGDMPPSPLIASSVEDVTESNKEDIVSAVNSPMMDIFLKVSDSRAAAVSTPGVEPDATWRQAIYEKVVQPPDNQDELTSKDLLGVTRPPPGKRTREQLRQLWKMAIDQTILLVRMEKENAKLRENEESSAVRRIKLEYTELGACDATVGLMWDSLLNARDPSQPMAKVDRHMLTQAVMQGVPRMSRGGVWYFLAEQHCLRAAPPDVRRFPLYHHSYRALIAGLTKHQHAILIDLGRTFPKHSYFASALGPGQLALYNILKAYSLLDPDVGYCQGLSFVAGVLLLHMEESDAFVLLRHLMFRRGLRKQYLPDMQALQVQLYQLSRLLRDHEPELHSKLEALDISPALYAAPWMLTLFTSQFPLGFVVRVFDLIFLDSFDVVFSFSLALLSVHRDGLMLCESCEEAAEYLKHKLPDMDKHIYDRVMKKVHTLDISRQLSDYAVEYAVLREEMPRLAALTDDYRKLKADSLRMGGQLDSAMDAMNNYQKIQSRLEATNKQMEQQLSMLSRFIATHHKQDMPPEIKKIVQNYNKKISFSSKILKFTLNDDEEADPKKNFKTLASAPNLFAKISKEDVINAANKDKTTKSIENDRKQFLMKKSQSVHSGLIAKKNNNSLKILEENENLIRSNSQTENLKESLKELGKIQKGFFASTHEQIRQERLFEQQLKDSFDENLKRLDEKLQPKDYMDDVNLFQSRRAMSLNLRNSYTEDHKNDSGFSTPITPKTEKIEEKRERDRDSCSTISHPLSDCDVDIKIECQSTQLKQLRPLRKGQ